METNGMMELHFFFLLVVCACVRAPVWGEGGEELMQAS